MRWVYAFMGIVTFLSGCTNKDLPPGKKNKIAIPASLDGYIKLSSKDSLSSKVGEIHILYVEVEIGDYAAGPARSGKAFFHRLIVSESPFERKDLEVKENFNSGKLVYAALMVKDVYPEKTNDHEIEIDPMSKVRNRYKVVAHGEWMDRPNSEILEFEHFLFLKSKRIE
jgi:hypothetical protein